MQEYWSKLPFPTQGIKPMSPVSAALADRFLTTSATWEAQGLLLNLSILELPWQVSGSASVLQTQGLLI